MYGKAWCGGVVFRTQWGRLLVYSVLVDDQRAVIADGEFGWWVPVVEFLPPYTESARELDQVSGAIRERIT